LRGDARTGSRQGYQRAGVDRMTISPPTGDLAELRPILERFRREVIEPLST
ncbi:MAG: hypothetical protein GY937_28510, partial [bacterium]|nr:hypothetical protein [bacterium]